MKRKKYAVKFCIQLYICIVITLSALVMKNSSNTAVSEYYDKLCSVVCHNITVSELQEVGSIAVSKLKDTPARIVSTVVQVNKNSQYGVPIDETRVTETVKQVHSVAGGMVQSVGKSSEKGLFVVVKHEEAVSTYGQLEDVSVVPNERVQRGEIIGSYNPECGNEFYYELTPDM